MFFAHIMFPCKSQHGQANRRSSYHFFTFPQTILFSFVDFNSDQHMILLFSLTAGSIAVFVAAGSKVAIVWATNSERWIDGFGDQLTVANRSCRGKPSTPKAVFSVGLVCLDLPYVPEIFSKFQESLGARCF